MDVDRFIAQAWDDHVTDAAGVAALLEAHAVGLVGAPAHVAPLARLVHHVFGEHLARWDEGRALLAALGQVPGCAPDAETAARLRDHDAALALAAGRADALDGLAPGTRVGVLAMAAASLVPFDTRRAGALFTQALAEAEPLPEAEPYTRALAVGGHGLACTLEDRSVRDADERALMLLAAQTSRRCWAIAGTWLETERADYRLAKTWLQAGDPAQALVHAQACLDRVAAHGDVPLERFFACEVLALAHRAAGHGDHADAAVAQAQAAFDLLGEGDRGWCRATLDAMLQSSPA